MWMHLNQSIQSLLVELVVFLLLFQVLRSLNDFMHPFKFLELLLYRDLLELVEHLLRHFILKIDNADF